MGVLKKLSGLFKRKKTVTGIEIMSDLGNGFYAWDGKLYQSDLIRACIRPKVRALGMLEAKHFREMEAKGGKDIKENPDVYMKMLLREPNPYMTGQVYQEKMATQLMLNNNAFALIIRNEDGYPMERYPIIASSVEAIYDKRGELFLRFWLRQSGKMYTFPYRDIIHLRGDFNENDLFGTPPAPALANLMEVVTTIDGGIVKAIKNSAVVRWLLKISGSSRPEDIEKYAKNFADSYLSNERGTGVAAVDAKADAQQIVPNDYVPNALQIANTTKRVMAFFNTNEKIVQSNYTEDEWNSYFEAQIRPDAKQMSEEDTRKLFTRKERIAGNSILYDSSSLQYASLATKLALVAMVDRNSLTPNEWRRTFNLGPIDGGDKPLLRKDTERKSEQ